MNTQYESIAEGIARKFHDTYEQLAPEHGYATREATRKKWSELPDNNRSLMIATVEKLIDAGIIAPNSW